MKKGALGLPNGTRENLQEAKWGQNGPKRLPKESPESTILGFGRETSEKVKIELPCRRELNFRGSNTFEIELFWCFLRSRISVEKGTRPRCLKIGSLGSLGAPWEGPRAKMGPPKGSPGEPKGFQNPIKIGVFSPVPRGRFQDLSPGAPRGPFRKHF